MKVAQYSHDEQILRLFMTFEAAKNL